MDSNRLAVVATAPPEWKTDLSQMTIIDYLCWVLVHSKVDRWGSWLYNRPRPLPLACCSVGAEPSPSDKRGPSPFKCIQSESGEPCSPPDYTFRIKMVQWHQPPSTAWSECQHCLAQNAHGSFWHAWESDRRVPRPPASLQQRTGRWSNGVTPRLISARSRHLWSKS